MNKRWKKCTVLKIKMNRRTVEARSTTTCKEVITLTSISKKMNTWRKRRKLQWMSKASASWLNRCSLLQQIFNNSYRNKIKRIDLQVEERGQREDPTPTTSSTIIRLQAKRHKVTWTSKWLLKLSVKLQAMQILKTSPIILKLISLQLAPPQKNSLP